MKNVILVRINDRLLHGQVVVSWIPNVNANDVEVDCRGANIQMKGFTHVSCEWR